MLVLVLVLPGTRLAQAQAAPTAGLVINEILYDPPEDVPEFIELLNHSHEAIDLSRYTLADAVSAPVPVSAETFLLPPGSFAVLTRDGTQLATAFPETRALQPERWPALNNSGDVVVLRKDGVAVDSVRYYAGCSEQGRSVERKDPYGPSSHPSNWSRSIAEAGATPGLPNSTFARDLTPPRPWFAGQLSPEEVDVYFSEPVRAASRVGASFLLNGQLASETSAVSDSVWRVRFPALSLAGDTETHLSVSGVADLAGNEMPNDRLVVARMPPHAVLSVNEILFEPLADRHDGLPDQPEYVEFYNAAPYTVSLLGAYWTTLPDEDGAADTVRFSPGAASVPPKGYAVVYADTARTAVEPDESMLAAAFPHEALAPGHALVLPLRRSSLGLLNDGGLIRLHRADGAILDELAYDPSLHHPSLALTRGVSLERITPGSESASEAGWTSSVDPSGGTPGRANSVAWTPGETLERAGIDVRPSPFSPDGDGHEDTTGIVYTLNGDGASIRVRIFDSHGRLVATPAGAMLASRTGTLLWNGLGESGAPLPMGIYVVHLEAVYPAAGTVEAYRAALVLARRLD